MAVNVDLCTLEDRRDLMNFIRDHWSANHVLARSAALMDWQHRDEANRRYNFIAARDRAKGIVGILGFILASRYDPALGAAADTLWLTTWKDRPDFAHGLGLLLLRKLDSMVAQKWIGTVGLNLATRGIYRALGYRVDTLTRHYMLNGAVGDFKLATVPLTLRAGPELNSGATLRELNAGDFMASTERLGLDDSVQVPRKSRAYLRGRYLSHPFYRYRAVLVTDGPHAAICVLRECRFEDASALRLVDFLGSAEALTRAGAPLQDLLRQSGGEYLDFFCSGMRSELAAAGFRELPPAAESPIM